MVEEIIQSKLFLIVNPEPKTKRYTLSDTRYLNMRNSFNVLLENSLLR